MSSDTVGAVLMICILLIIYFVKPVRVVVKEAFGTNERERRNRQALEFDPPNVHGNAQIANELDIQKAGYFTPGGIRFGLVKHRPLFYNGKGHLLLVCAARGGKAFTILVSMILSLSKRFSLYVVDPKLELTCITAHFRKSIGPTYVYNPFNRFVDRLKGINQVSINAMDVLDVRSPDFHAVCDKIAVQFWSATTGLSEPHWQESGGTLCSGLIAFLKRYGTPDQQNLPYMRDVLTGATGESLFDFCRRAMTCDDVFIRQKLAKYAQKGAEDNREIASIISTADTATSFMGNKAVADSMKNSTFRFRDLKRVPGSTLYLGLPLEMMDVTEKLYRLVSAVMFYDTLAEQKGAPIVAIMDEVAQLGPMKILTDLLGMGAGAASLQLVLVYQSISQVMAQFGQQWANVIQNCGVSIWFKLRDQTSRQTVSELSGITELISHSKNVSYDERHAEFNVSMNASQMGRPLLHPHEVGEICERPDKMVVFAENINGPIIADRKPYLKEFRGKYRDNPFYRKSA